MAKTKDRVLSAAESAKPYVDRALRDEEFRENLRAAFLAARDIYNELTPPRGVSAVAQRVATDEEIQQNLRRAIAELRSAADRLQRRKRQSHLTRNLLLIFAGVAVGLFFNPYTGPEARRWARERISGRRDTFSYPNGSQSSGFAV